tara:strand:+ start:145 stop:849 length:705 start_codon:yes stop_codon:yes gene_type:complete
MSTVVKLKRSEVASRIPSSADLEVGEIAVNLADAKIFAKKQNGDVVTLNPDVNNITNNLTLPYDWGSISDSDGDEYDMGLITDANDAPENAGFNELQAATFILNGLNFPTADGISGQVLTTDGSGNLSWINSSTSASWQNVNNNTAASIGDKVIVDSPNPSNQPITITLPANPNFGEEVSVIDGTANSQSYNITINRNGRNIDGAAEDFEIDVNGAGFNFVYFNSTRGWILQEK